MIIIIYNIPGYFGRQKAEATLTASPHAHQRQALPDKVAELEGLIDQHWVELSSLKDSLLEDSDFFLVEQAGDEGLAKSRVGHWSKEGQDLLKVEGRPASRLA